MTTARFGDKKFGTFKFGPTVLTQPRFALEVDWPGNGYFTGESEGRRMRSLSIERGRKYYITPEGDGFQPQDTGRFAAVLDNDDGRFDPYNTSSPLDGTLGPGKLFRIKVRTPEDAYYNLMSGILSEPTPYDEGAIPKVRLEGADGWKILRDQHNQVTIGLQESIYADDAFRLVLNVARWPSLWGSDLDSGVDQRPYWWVTQQSPSAAMHDLGTSEMGRMWVAADGKFTFRSRHYVDTPVVTLGPLDIIKNGLRILQPVEVIRNVIRVTAKPRAAVATGELYRSDDPIFIRSGETINLWAKFSYGNEDNIPAKNVITPVATTDYLVNTSADGSGTNITGSVSATATHYSTESYVSITNNSASSGWITTIRVRGDAIAVSNDIRFQEEDLPSIQSFTQRTLNLESDWLQNPNVARSLALFLKSFIVNARKYLVVDLMPNPEVQFAADLGQEIYVNHPGRNIDEIFRLINIKHEWVDPKGIVTRTRWILEPFEQADLSGWRVPSQVPMRVAF